MPARWRRYRPPGPGRKLGRNKRYSHWEIHVWCERGGAVIAIDGCHVATVDAAGTEHPRGSLVLDGDRIAAVGAGPAAGGVRGGGAGGRVGHAGHAGAGQHPSPPVPVDHPRLRDRRHAVRLADRAVPDLGPAGRRAGARVGRGQPGLAGADRLHDHDRPPLRLPGRGRRPARGRDRARRGRSALRFHPTRGLDEPRPVRRAGCRRTRSSSSTTTILAATAGGDRPLARPVAGRDDRGSRSRPARRSRSPAS